MPTSRKNFLKQAGFALIGATLPFSKLFAKRKMPIGDSYHPRDCMIVMTNEPHYTIEQITIEPGFYSKPDGHLNETNLLPLDVMYKEEGDGIGGGTAGWDYSLCNPTIDGCRTTDFNPTMPTADGENPFRYTVYYPKIDVHDYVGTPLPCIVFYHAGGFQECPSYTLPIIRQLCTELSQRGFICFTIEYRRGRIKDIDTTKTTVQQELARYRGIQDACGAIRSIIKKNQSGEFLFKINENEFFVGGTSAGAIISMGASYYRTSSDLVTDQSMIDATYTKATGSTYNIKQVLGKMQSDYYYAPMPVNAGDPTYWPIIKGVACLWGGVVIPESFDNGDDDGKYEKNFFKDNTGTLTWANPPMIAFHGAMDTVVPFYDDDKQYLDLSPPLSNPPYPDFNSEDLCSVPTNRLYKQKTTDLVELKICSSLNMYRILKKLNRFTELYVDCQMFHGLDKSCEICDGSGILKTKTSDNQCVTCTFASNFGLANTYTSEPVTTYMGQRIAVFFQRIMYEQNNSTNPSPLPFGFAGRSFFKECINLSVCGETNHNSCTDPDKNNLCNGDLASFD